MTRHYGHARLLPGHVLGMWFLLDRDSGAPLWQRTFDRPNHLVGVSDQTIIASETVQVGCGWANQGCFAISLATGELTWTSHGDDATDRPTALVGDEVVCDSGRVLALQDGRLLRYIPHEEAREIASRWHFARLQSPANELYFRSFRPRRGRGPNDWAISWGDAGWLALKKTKGALSRDSLRLTLTDDLGEPVWTFDSTTTGYVINHYNFCACRLVGSHFYVVAAERPNTLPAPPPDYVKRIPTTYHLLTVELQRGTIVQDLLLADHPITTCRIEDADERALIINADEQELNCYARRP